MFLRWRLAARRHPRAHARLHVLDVHIPGRSGLDILRELNAQNYPAPIFIMSGQGDILMAVDAIRHGAFDFVEKLFVAASLSLAVREATDALARRGADEKASATLAFIFPPTVSR